MRNRALRLAATTLGLGLVCLAGGGCSGAASATAPHQVVRIATGFPHLAEAYSKVLPDITFVPTAAGTAQKHLEALERGSAEVGVALADVAYTAYVGSADAENGADRLRGMVVLKAGYVLLLVRPGLTVTNIAGLRGKRVALGSQGSEGALAAKMLLGSFGLSESDVRAEWGSYAIGLKRLETGDLDAVFVSGGVPNDLALEAARHGAHLLNINGPSVENLRTTYPFLRNTLIPAHTYAGQEKTVYTVGVDLILLCRADLDEDLVYRLTKALVDELPFLSSKGSYFQNIDFKRLMATPIPLHQGAARYYRERELFR